MLVKIQNIMMISVTMILLIGTFNSVNAKSINLECVQYEGCTKFDDNDFSNLFNSANNALDDDTDLSGPKDNHVNLTLVFEGGTISNNSWECTGGSSAPIDEFTCSSMIYALHTTDPDVCGVTSIVIEGSPKLGAAKHDRKGIVIATTSGPDLAHEAGHCGPANMDDISLKVNKNRIMYGSDGGSCNEVIKNCPKNGDEVAKFESLTDF